MPIPQPTKKETLGSDQYSSRLVKAAGDLLNPPSETPFKSRIKTEKTEKAPKPPKTPNVIDDFTDSLGDAPEAPSLASITESKRKSAQGVADLITQQFNSIIAGARVQGDKRAAITDATSRTSGLSGSSVAASNAVQTANENADVIRSYEAERDAKIASILSTVDDRASEDYAKQRELFLTENRDRTDRIAAFTDKVRTRAIDEVAAIAAAGGNFADFKTKNSKQYNQLLNESGLSEEGLKARFIVNAPKGSIVNQDDPIIVDGVATYFSQKINPETGAPEFTPITVKLPEGYKTKGAGIKQIVPRKDGLYVIKEDGTYDVIGQPESDGTEGGYKFTNDDRGQITALGLSAGDISQLEKDINDYGADRALAGLDDESQKSSIKRILGGSTQFIDKDFLKQQYQAETNIDNMLKAMGKERDAYAAFFSKKSTEEENIKSDYNDYIDSVIESLMPIVEQYRNKGFSDKEIVAMIQK